MKRLLELAFAFSFGAYLMMFYMEMIHGLPRHEGLRAVFFVLLGFFLAVGAVLLGRQAKSGTQSGGLE